MSQIVSFGVYFRSGVADTPVSVICFLSLGAPEMTPINQPIEFQPARCSACDRPTSDDRAYCWACEDAANEDILESLHGAGWDSVES